MIAQNCKYNFVNSANKNQKNETQSCVVDINGLDNNSKGELETQSQGNELYKGKIYHIFFHSLIVHPEKAFKSRMAQGYKDWMTTKDEFVKTLPLLYKNNFVLIDIESLIEKKNGRVVKKNIYLPKGKKPLIISVDDVCYYNYMKNDGFASKLVLDKNGRVTNLINENGKLVESRQADVVPILDDFVAKHPDFSINGAKGVLAVTGYEGALGYRVSTLTGEKLAKEKMEAKKVVAALKQNGWKFACHSYTHKSKFKTGEITLNELKQDTLKWKRYIEPIVGKTSIYISPFGMHLASRDKRMKYLNYAGFNIYCPVGKRMNVRYFENVMIQCRLNFDGWTFKNAPIRISKHFFDPQIIVDPKRKLSY